MLVHLINHSAENLGGAQKILKLIYDDNEEHSKIISFDYIKDKSRQRRSNYLFATLAFFSDLIRKHRNTFIIHHRIFLIPFIFMRNSNSIFICHNIFPSKNFIFKHLTHLKIIAVSSEVKDYLHTVNPKLNITVIPNGVSVNEAENFERNDNGTFKIGFIGRLAKEKGIYLLLEAFRAFITDNQHVNTELHIVGSGELDPQQLENAALSDLSNKITFHGYSDAPFTLLKHVDLLVVPSQFEGFGLVYYEALERGHMVLASNLPVFRKKTDDLGVEFFIQNDATDLAHKMANCRDKQDLWITAGSPLKRHDFLTTDDMLSNYKTFLESTPNEQA